MRLKAFFTHIQVGLLLSMALTPMHGASARPGSAKVRLILEQANTHLSQKRYAAASELINRAPEIAAVPEAQCVLAHSYLGERRYQNSLDSWERCDKEARGLAAEPLRQLALTRDRARAGLLFEQGRHARGAQRCEDAEDAFKKAYLLSAEPRLLCEQADAVSCRGQLDDALALYERCINDLTRLVEEAPSAEELDALNARRQQVLAELGRRGGGPAPEGMAKPAVPGPTVETMAPAVVTVAPKKEAAAQAKKPFYRRPLFYIGTGLGVAVTATAAAIPAMLPGDVPPPPNNPPSFCTEQPSRCTKAGTSLRIVATLRF